MTLLLWGVGMVRNGFMRAFGATLRRAIARSTSNRFKAFLTGLGVTAVLQSSTATCLIVTSFATRGLIAVSAAMAVVLGADVGTTLVAQLLSLDLSWLAPLLLIAGYIVDRKYEASQMKYLGRAFVGLALMLMSLKMVVGASEPLQHSEALGAVVKSLAGEPLLAIIIAAGMTWLAHSSLAIVLLFMSLAQAGTIPIMLGLTLVLGANLGGTLTPLVMTMKENPEGRRVPLGNLMMRCIGVVLVLPVLEYLEPALAAIDPDPARQIVNFHTAFNLALAALFIPFIGPLTTLSAKLLPERPAEEDESRPRYLDTTALGTPTAALACASRETLRVSDIIQRMLRDSMDAIMNNDSIVAHEVRKRDDVVDSLYEEIKRYLARVTAEQLDSKESSRYMQILTFSTNLEHVGDIIDKGLMELAKKKTRNQDNFSEEGQEEITRFHAQVLDNLKMAQNVFMSRDVDMARALVKTKEEARSDEISASKSHLLRIQQGVQETMATSSLHLDIIRDLRRINSYITAIAYPILEEAGQTGSGKASAAVEYVIDGPLTPEEGGSIYKDENGDGEDGPEDDKEAEKAEKKERKKRKKAEKKEKKSALKDDG